MKPFRTICLGLLLVTSLPIIATLGGRIFSVTLAETPYVVAPDEAYTLAAEASFLNEGYWGFRCKASQMSYCYGGTQTLIDLVTLAPFSREWLKNDRTSTQGLQVRWPYLIEYPNVAKVLRWQRAAFIVGLIGLVFLWAYSVGARAALVFALLLVTSYPLLYAWHGQWRGVKSDFPGAFFAVLQLALAWHARRATKENSSPKKLLGLWLLLNLLGIAATTVRASNLPLWLASAAWFLWWVALKKREEGNLSAITATKTLAIYLTSAALAGGAYYLALHPQTWATYQEAKWILYYLQLGSGSQVPHASWPASLLVLAHASREILLLASVAGIFLIRRGAKEFVVDHGYFILAILPQLKNAVILGYPSYYLTLSTIAVAGSIALLRSTGLTKNVLAAIAGLGAIWNIAFIGQELWPLAEHARIAPVTISPVETELMRAAPLPEKRFLVDRTLRLPVTEANEGAFVFFDSLTDSLAQAQALAQEHQNVERIFVSCWKRQEQIMSPAAEQWSRALAKKCGDHPRELKVLSFRQIIAVLRGQPIAEISRAELREMAAQSRTLPALTDPTLRLRSLPGSSTLADSWEESLLTGKDATLKGSFLLGFDGSLSHWKVSSYCRGEATVSLKVSRNEKLAWEKEISVNTEGLFCELHPILCRINRERLADFFRNRKDFLLEFAPLFFRRGDRIGVEVKVTAPSGKQPCWVAINDLGLEPEPSVPPQR